MKKVLLRVVIFVMFILFPGFVYSVIPASERAALIALYNNTNGAGWNNNTNWLGAPGSENTWYGITVQNILGTDHVTEIYLDYNNLSGSIPTELGNL